MSGCTGKIDDDGNYAVLKMPSGEAKVLIRAVDHPPRVHCDIETDDQKAEATRLEGVGARQIGAVKSWIVMETPTGHRFCLVEPQRDDIDRDAREFDRLPANPEMRRPIDRAGRGIEPAQPSSRANQSGTRSASSGIPLDHPVAG
nr:VOC family protein [Aurantimonas sp. 22II-16-19i]